MSSLYFTLMCNEMRRKNIQKQKNLGTRISCRQNEENTSDERLLTETLNDLEQKLQKISNDYGLDLKQHLIISLLDAQWGAT